MNRLTLAVAFALAAGLAAGCNNYDGTGSLSRQEGDIHTKDPAVSNRVTSPIQGETTGDGQKTDSRTGGRLTGTDLSGRDAEKTAPVAVPPDNRNTGPIRTNTEAGTNPNRQ